MVFIVVKNGKVHEIREFTCSNNPSYVVDFDGKWACEIKVPWFVSGNLREYTRLSDLVEKYVKIDSAIVEV